MIYRISFIPRGAYWQIEFQTWLMRWVPVSKQIEGSGTPVAQVLKFDTFAEAEAKVREFGIPHAYHQTQTMNAFTAIQAGDSRQVQQEVSHG